MSEPEINPRIDDEGPMCFFVDDAQTEKCPQIYGRMCCRIDNFSHWTKLCPHHVKRLAALLREFRDSLTEMTMRNGEKYYMVCISPDVVGELRTLLGGK